MYAPTYAAKKAAGKDPGDNPIEIGTRIVKGEADRLSKEYGPSARGEKDARKKQLKRFRKDGTLMPALDVATVVAPVSASVGGTVRATAAANTARGAKGLSNKIVERPKLKTGELSESRLQRSRKGASGLAASVARDAARGAVQKAAVARAKKTGKPLPARRALVQPGEVVPIRPRRARTKQRVDTARTIGMGEAAATLAVKRHVTDTGKKATSTRKSFKGLPKPDEHIAITAAQLGIKDAAGAAGILSARIAEIERTIAAAKADKNHPDAAAARREGSQHEAELSRLRALLADPKVFERPDVQRAAEGVRARRVTERETLATERAAGARANLVGATLGIKTARETTVAARKARIENVKKADAAIAAKRKEVETYQRKVAVERARTSEAAIGNRVRVGDTASLKSISRHEAKLAKRKAAAPRHGRLKNMDEVEGLHAAIAASLDKATPLGRTRAIDWSRGGGGKTSLGDAAQVRKDFAPLRDYLRRTHGDTIRLYRGERPGFTDDGRAHETWTANKAIARDYAGDSGRIHERQVPVDDIIGATAHHPKHFDAPDNWDEFIVQRGAPTRAPMPGRHSKGSLPRVARAGDDMLRGTRGLKVAKQELRTLRAQRKDAAAPVRHREESNSAYEARVAAHQEAEGRVAPAYVPSKHEIDEGLLPLEREMHADANPLGKKRTGTLYRTGNEDKSLAHLEQQQAAALKRGRRIEARTRALEKHGKFFRDEAAANKWLQDRGASTQRDRKSDMVIVPVPGGIARKGTVTPRRGRDSDQGDYVKTDDVVLLPRAVHQEILDLDKLARTPAKLPQRVMAGSQAVLLGANPAWFQFQRVNDLVAAVVGGSAISTRKMQQLRTSLSPDEREALTVVAGGSMAGEMLTPHSVVAMGKARTLLDKNPLYRKAFGGENPATILLRTDQKITGGVRERQLLYNLNKIARDMDPDVKAVWDGFEAVGTAFRKNDPELIGKLLTDPTHRKRLDEASERLDKVMGDWHNYTAREKSYKHYAAFYGFLRYSTRMALFTLPIGHPNMGLLIARLGIMGSEDAKKIVGKDMPWGLGTLYNKDGTIAADFIRANPLTGPLTSITKPEHLVGLSTPLASWAASTVMGQAIGLNDAAEGYIKKITVRGDKNRPPGGLLGEDRIRAAGISLLRFFGPVSEWQRFDNRQQSSDSLPWDRRYMDAPGGADLLRLRKDNAERTKSDGLTGLAHNVLPLAFPGSKRNVAKQGENISKAKQIRDQKETLRRLKFKARTQTDLGMMKRDIEAVKAEIAEDLSIEELDQLKHDIKVIKAELEAGGG